MEHIAELIVSAGDFCKNIGGQLVSIVLILPFLLLCLILVPIFMTKGFKRGVYRASVSVGCTLCSFGVALLGAKLTAQLLTEPVYRNLEKELIRAVGKYADKGSSFAYIGGFAKGIISSLLGAVTFFVLFVIFLILSKVIIGKIVLNPLTRKDAPTGFKLGGMALGLLDALLVAFLLFAPLYSFAGFSADLLDQTAESIRQSAEETKDSELVQATRDVSAFCDSISDNPVIRLSTCPVFNFSTSFFGNFRCEGKTYNSYRIMKDGAAIFADAMPVILYEPENYGQDQLDAVEKIANRCKKNQFFFGVLSEMVYGFIGAEDTQSGGSYTDEMLNSLKKELTDATAADYAECTDSLMSLFRLTVDSGVIRYVKNEGMLLARISDEAFIREAVGYMRKSKILSGSLDSLVAVSADLMAHSESANGQELEGILENIKKEIRAQSNAGTPDIEKETQALYFIFSGIRRIHDTSGSFRNQSFLEFDSEGVAEVLIGFGMHPYVGEENVNDLLSSTLRSFNQSSGGLFNEEFISNALSALHHDIQNPPHKDEHGEFEGLLVSASHAIRVVKELGTNSYNKREMEDLIEQLMTVITPSAAATLNSAMTGSVMTGLNVQSGNKEKVSDFVSDMLLNMADVQANGGNPKKEKEGIMEMTSLTISAKDKLKDKQDGSRTSLEEAVDGDLEGFLTKVSSSKVMMQTVEQSLEKNGSDPTGSFQTLTEEDEQALQNACKDLIDRNPDDTELPEKLAKICRFMGAELN